MVDFGTDYNMNATVDENGDISIVTDYDNLRQRIHNILLVPFNYYGDDFGSYLYELLGNDLNEDNIKLIELYIKSYIKKDERIEDVIISDVKVNINRDIIIGVSVITYDDEEVSTIIEINNNGLVEVGNDD